MAMTKGYCTNCNKDNEIRRIFDVNSDVKFCHCPHCGKKYRPSVVIRNYKKVITNYLNRASFYLKNVNEVQDAYNLYAYVLELEPSNKIAKLGRLLSLGYLSKVRRHRFLEVKTLLEIEAPLFHTPEARQNFKAFLIELEHCTQSYLEHLRKRLTFKGYFYDVECLKLYYKHIRDIIELRRLIVSEFSLIEEQRCSSEAAERIQELEGEYHEQYITADGQDHLLANFSKSGDPLISNGKKKVDTKLSRYRMSTLDKNDKKLNVIDDEVFPKVYRRMYRFYKPALPLSILIILIALVLLVFYFIFFHYDCAPYILSLVIFFAVTGICFLLCYILFGVAFKKPRL